MLIGHTADEGTFFFASPWRPAPSPERIPAIVGHLCHTDAPGEVLGRYRERAAAAGAATDDASLLVQVATDAMIGAPVAAWARARAADGHRVFRYRFDHPGAGPQLLATHTAEVPLLFGSWRDGGPGERLGGQAPGADAVAAELVRAWAGFINEGDPGWAALDTDADTETAHAGADVDARVDADTDADPGPLHVIGAS